MLIRNVTRLHAPEVGAPQGNPAPADPETTPDSADAVVRRLIQRHGDAAAALAQLASENYALRTERREMRAQLPPAGAVVLQGADAQRWQAYIALGDDPAALGARLTAAEQATARVQQLERRAVIGQAAAAANYKANVLADRLGDRVVEVTQRDGKAVAEIIDGTTRTLLTDYAAQHWADYLPALALAPTTATPPTLPRQTAGQGAGATSPIDAIVASFQQQRDQAGVNPLAPRTTPGA